MHYLRRLLGCDNNFLSTHSSRLPLTHQTKHRHRQLYSSLGFVLMTTMLSSQILYADSALLKQKDARVFIDELVNNDQFSAKEVSAILAEAQFQPKIVSLMDKPYEKKNWDVYQALFLTQDRLDAGLYFWKNNQTILQTVSKQYGVPPEMIVAILGVETLYGKRQGDYRVLDALTTLAFYYPSRAAYFKKELREFLLLCREHHVSPALYKGSYAGAMGKPQFMPSSYRNYAVDYLGQGRPDLMSKDQDVIVSIANYFKQHGWQSQQLIAEQAHVPQQGLATLVLNSKSANYSLKELLTVGVSPTQNNPIKHPSNAGLLELLTDKGPEYWMAYPNFYVIPRYNSSPQYAMVVYLLAESLRKHHAAMIG